MSILVRFRFTQTHREKTDTISRKRMQCGVVVVKHCIQKSWHILKLNNNKIFIKKIDFLFFLALHINFLIMPEFPSFFALPTPLRFQFKVACGSSYQMLFVFVFIPFYLH